MCRQKERIDTEQIVSSNASNDVHFKTVHVITSTKVRPEKFDFPQGLIDHC